jgi:two-component sensor histidine kinase
VLSKVTKFLQNTSASVITLAGIFSVLAVGMADILTGKEISFSILYLLPVTFVGWFADRRKALFVGVLSVAAWLGADAYTGVVFSSPVIHIWNALARFGIYYFVIYLEDLLKERNLLLQRDVVKKSADLSIEKIEHKKTYESVKRLSLFPELNPNPIIEIDSRKNLTYLNKAAEEFINKQDSVQDYTIFLPADIDQILMSLSDKSKYALHREKNVGSQVIEEYIYFIHHFQVVQIYAADITERKKAENELKNSLKEKEILLREIHHRVKNNLQIISSLLKLQSAFIKNEDDQAVFLESQRRIGYIASIHQMLYKEGDVARINAGRFFSELAARLYQLYEGSGPAIKFDIKTDELYINAEDANPMGLLVTEVISNSLKHAFKGKNEGVISITLLKKNSGFLELSIGDNGIGIGRDISKEKSPTLGLHLIDLLAGQIDAVYSVDSSRGTAYTFMFKGSEQDTKKNLAAETNN